MYKEVLDWISFFAGIFTVCAAIATLYAVWIAHTTWKTWKNQQNYSFARDKIFECELIVNKLTVTLTNYINGYYHYRLKVINNELIDHNEYEQLFKNQGLDNSQLLTKYDEMLGALDILKIECDRDVIINKLFIASKFDEYIAKINQCTESKELVTLFWQQLLPEMQDFRKGMLTELKSKRENL
ncbi:hypothetical protein VSN93_17270 [Acinetobacter johnsonii]|uniref:hypothetical protein n=1 Tax=Acinetobacter johnsonii TaxID=40214 RepID=UPI003D16C109